MTQCERHIQLVAKVREMRTAQKQYFISRNQMWLAEAKRLEIEVDTLLAGELYYPTTKEQGNAQHS
jgi:hypothetical protein